MNETLVDLGSVLIIIHAIYSCLDLTLISQFFKN